ncbi:HWE histidine kinase domain-containing protein [Roseicella aerolata]|uniref:histidine kinase n=1 Tax=Roseicella aerolata TaxID=2883479 RepID=A0A9X1IBT7_9PROT|nr:HWE histidine kinase domain-containing protein [Roseicella aerolata]MCB4821622.1 GAF domain-containing protein [Roseicella aerolata]
MSGGTAPEAEAPGFGQVDLTNCDREPIHIPGSIQPHGLLLILAPGSLAVLQAAGDAQRLLGWEEGGVAGRPLDALLPPEALAAIHGLLAPGSPQPGALEAVLPDGRRLDLILHRTEAGLLLEIEPVPAGAPGTRLSLLPRVQAMVAQAATARNLREACQVAAEQLRGLTGFDRVMIYRFLEDGSGAVVAEARDADIDAFLGLHYPASDIPRQARELYLRNWIRLIPDARYRPAPLLPPVSPLTGQPPDLSLCGLRSVSPLHIEYLANMGVAASMSLSLIRGGQLWGLISCHHRSPRPVPFATRAASEVFAQMFSLQLETHQQAEDFAYSSRQRRVHEALVQVMAQEADPAFGLIRHRPNMLDLIQSEGAAVLIEDRYAAIGRTPEEADVRAFAAWIGERARDGVVALDRLPEVYPPARAFAEVASGALVLPVSREPRDIIIWFRPEMPQTVNWAGNPNKPVEVTPEGGRLTPRKSFEAWRETVRGRAHSWKPVEIEAAQALRVSLLEVVVRRLDEVARERAKAKERQDFLMAELDHRVKNTLATIQALVRHTRGGAATLDEFVSEFGQRLQAMAQAHSLLARSRWEGAGLRALLEEALRAHCGAPGGAPDRILLDGPELRLKPKAALALCLALHELTTNAAKYGALSVPEGRLRIAWWLADDRVLLEWVESHGPPVPADGRRGFGTTVIERGLAYEIGGAVTLAFDPSGLRCRVELPLRQVVDARTLLSLLPAPSQRPSSAHPRLRGRRVLVVEDALLVAMELEAALSASGVEIIGPAASLGQALNLIRQQRIDAALLDIDLDGALVYPAADLLVERGVPVAFATGYDAASVLPQRFRGMPVLPKPFNGEEACQLLCRMLGLPLTEG